MEIRIHNKLETLRMHEWISNFHRQLTRQSQYHWMSYDLMLYNYTIVLSAGVWTSSTHDWHHSSWVLLTSQRYQFLIQHVTSIIIKTRKMLNHPGASLSE